MITPAYILISTTVDAPVWRAYGTWRRAENFPKFIDTVLEVRRVAVNQLCWFERIDGKEYQTVVEVNVLANGECGFGWKSLSGPKHWGSIRFEAKARGVTFIKVEMECVAEDKLPSAQALGEKVTADLKAFKLYMEGLEKMRLQKGSEGKENMVTPSVRSLHLQSKIRHR